MSTSKKFQILGILIYYVIASFIIAWLKLGYLSGTLIYLGIPSVFITYQKPSLFKKSFYFSIILSAPIVLVFNYIGTMSKAWFEITSSGIRILGAFPIETFIWAFLVVFFSIVFYEYYFDGDKEKNKLHPHNKYLIFIMLALVSIFGVIFLWNKELLVINYFYLYFAVGLFVLPPLIIILEYPKLMQKVIYQGLFFLLLSVIYEITALYSEHWIFPGNYIGFVEITGFRFPLEEFLWLTFCVPSIITIYEIFEDDQR